jgi:NAD(P)H-flavin reductase
MVVLMGILRAVSPEPLQIGNSAVIEQEHLEQLLRALADRGYEVVGPTVHEGAIRAASAWRRNVGVVTTMIPRAPFDSSNTMAMICGPEVMMRFAVMELLKHGVAVERIYLSGERNMKCGIGLCGHCQLGPMFTCKDGPVFAYARVSSILGKSEV